MFSPTEHSGTGRSAAPTEQRHPTQYLEEGSATLRLDGRSVTGRRRRSRNSSSLRYGREHGTQDARSFGAGGLRAGRSCDRSVSAGPGVPPLGPSRRSPLSRHGSGNADHAQINGSL